MVTYTPIERISITSNLGFTKSLQDSVTIATQQIGGNTSSIPIGIGLAYAKSEKLQISMGTGVRINSNGPADDFYEISANVGLPRDYRFTLSVGSATDKGQENLGIDLKTDFIRAQLRRRFLRQTIISANMDISKISFVTQNALASALGNSTRTEVDPDVRPSPGVS